MLLARNLNYGMQLIDFWSLEITCRNQLEIKTDFAMLYAISASVGPLKLSMVITQLLKSFLSHRDIYKCLIMSSLHSTQIKDNVILSTEITVL